MNRTPTLNSSEILPDRPFTGRVIEIGASALPTTGAGAAAREFRVVVRLDDPDPSLRPGLTFMTFHFQDEVATNVLTTDASDPKSGTAEFKATAIRIEKLEASIPA